MESVSRLAAVGSGAARHRLGEQKATRGWKFRGVAFAWLILFPNAPYIFTDLIHLPSPERGHYWVDLVLILLFALTGFLVEFVSLRLMQSLVARWTHWLVGWLFVGMMAGLSGFGVYLGRFRRWNSWDVMLNPLDLLVDVGHRVLHPFAHPTVVVFPALFAVFFLAAYLMLTALIELRADDAAPPSAE